MKPRRTALPLPRYTERKPLKRGGWAYYFNIPSWARKANPRCPIANEALGTDYDAAVRRAEDVLLPIFDSWLSGGASDGATAPVILAGTLDWVFAEYRKTWTTPTAKRLAPLSLGQQRNHDVGIRMVSDHLLANGQRLGAQRVKLIDSAVVDKLFEKLLIKTGKDGKRIERRTTVNAAMRTCRAAWNTVSRAHPGQLGINPFAAMGLIDTSKESAHASYAELQAFRAKAVELGYQSLATGALVSFLLLQRTDHVFKHFNVAHYRPPQYPDRICVVSPKTQRLIWSPLFNDQGEALFPELMAELDAMKALRPTGGLMLRRDASGRVWATKGERLTHLSRTAKDIIRAAGLRDELTFSAFRHGGFTEAAAAKLTDRQIIAQAQHTTPKNLRRYVHADDEIIISGHEMRAEARTKRAQKPGTLSE
jgi:hypothetical protein